MVTPSSNLTSLPQSTRHSSLSSSFLASKPSGCHNITLKHNRYRFCPKATAGGNRNLATAWAPTSVPVRVAHELLQAGQKYLDVRTYEEFSGGHAPGAINIPYLYRVGSGMAMNPDFVAQVSSHFRKDDEFVVGCQIGKRSMMAATELIASGFTGITDISGGYAAWAQTGLGTER